MILATAAAAALAVSPAPGTPDASPKTQISVLGAAPSSVTAVGAQTGPHAGVLRSYSAVRGASFLPAQSFAEGERVDVTLRLRGAPARKWSFTVAKAGTTPPVLNLKTTQPGKLQHFVSEPDLVPPQITVRKRGAESDGSIFLTPLPSPVVHPGSTATVTISPVGPGGPMIVDARGRLVWFKQLAPPDVAANLRIQRFGGRRVLTWWEGPVTAAAFGLGSGVIADSAYRTLRRVRAGNGYAMDIHELTLTPEGTALFPVYVPVVHDGTPLLDAIVQEVDIRTGLVVWEWHALGHVPLKDSYATPANSAFYDAFHINAIQALSGGRVLISMRDTSAVYMVKRAGGRVLWTLGGKAGDFTLGPGARFWFQHDAQLHGDRLSVFDDEAGPPQKAPSSRALFLKLDTKRMRATVARSLKRAEPTSAQSEGSVQTLPGGNVFAGFGAEPWFSQWDARGRVVFDAKLPDDDGSYRVYRFPWRAAPTTKPRAVVFGRFVYASWNGATDVARWQVLSGGRVVASARRTGFETRIPVDGGGPFTLRALDARGRRLGGG